MGSERLKVTIVMPSFNHGRFIGESIKSVIEQDYTNLEFIIIDGGSCDETRDIIAKYAKYIDKVISEPDNGQSDAINKGFRMASGDIVAWLNSDDMYFPGAISGYNRKIIVLSIPLVFLGLTCWSYGEFWGYLEFEEKAE